MPILMKDEKKYSECVDVLDQLEKWTYEIYSAAGLCTSSDAPAQSTYQPPCSDTTVPTIGHSSRPDQPASHVPPTASEDDPLKGIKYHATVISSLVFVLLVLKTSVQDVTQQSRD